MASTAAAGESQQTRVASLDVLPASTIHGIDGILSGAFATAKRWDWVERNPTEAAKPPRS
jgi:hypothetical protein